MWKGWTMKLINKHARTEAECYWVGHEKIPDWVSTRSFKRNPNYTGADVIWRGGEHLNIAHEGDFIMVQHGSLVKIGAKELDERYERYDG